MYWNYRVVVKDGNCSIYEVYYDDNGRIEAFTEEPVGPSGESLEELRQDLEYFIYPPTTTLTWANRWDHVLARWGVRRVVSGFLGSG